MMVMIHHSDMQEGRETVVRIEGALNGSAAVDLEEYTDTLIARGARALLIDGAAVDFISSAGIGAILLINAKVRRAGGSMALFSLNDETLTLCRLLGFEKELIMAADRQDALRQVQQRAAEGGTPAGPEMVVQPVAMPVSGPEPSQKDPGGLQVRTPAMGAAPAGPEPAVHPPLKEVSEPLKAEIPVSATDETEKKGPEPVAEEPPVRFANPVIVECKTCGTLVRARQEGDYRCPQCSAEFTVLGDMTVRM
ncbi:MAG: STAS domain-containing protein [Spirochaetes bacterium]|nr:STAS domain-containing protein [Spirochaetota bacterium]